MAGRAAGRSGDRSGAVRRRIGALTESPAPRCQSAMSWKDQVPAVLVSAKYRSISAPNCPPSPGVAGRITSCNTNTPPGAAPSIPVNSRGRTRFASRFLLSRGGSPRLPGILTGTQFCGEPEASGGSAAQRGCAGAPLLAVALDLRCCGLFRIRCRTSGRMSEGKRRRPA